MSSPCEIAMNLTPAVVNCRMPATQFTSDRPKRSSFQTITASNLWSRASAMSASSPGRRAFEPLIWSW